MTQFESGRAGRGEVVFAQFKSAGPRRPTTSHPPIFPAGAVEVVESGRARSTTFSHLGRRDPRSSCGRSMCATSCYRALVETAARSSARSGPGDEKRHRQRGRHHRAAAATYNGRGRRSSSTPSFSAMEAIMAAAVACTLEFHSFNCS